MSKKSPSVKARPRRITAAADNKLGLCLYIAGNAPNSQLAIDNLANICDEYLIGRFQLEVVDVLNTPLRALADGVLVTPSLAVTSVHPAVRIIGNLNDRNSVLRAMGIK